MRAQVTGCSLGHKMDHGDSAVGCRGSVLRHACLASALLTCLHMVLE